MFKITEIRELIRLLDETSISELVVESSGTKLSIKKPETQVTYQTVPVSFQAPVEREALAAAAPKAELETPVQTGKMTSANNHPSSEKTVSSSKSMDEESLVKVVSPMVGTFYAAPSPDAPNYAKVGDKVTEKTVVCIVEAMKLMNEIEADVRGEIVAVLVENGQLVEYGQPMFLVKPE